MEEYVLKSVSGMGHSGREADNVIENEHCLKQKKRKTLGFCFFRTQFPSVVLAILEFDL